MPELVVEEEVSVFAVGAVGQVQYDPVTTFVQANPSLFPADVAKAMVEVEARPKPQTPRLDPRVVSLWDFLCRAAFMESREVPRDWVKTSIQRYFDLQDALTTK